MEDNLDIFKAIKLEKKYTKRFFVIMFLIAIILPLSVYLTGIMNVFYMTYLGIIEFLIFAAVINKINYTRLNYTCNKNRLRIKTGLLGKESLVFCDKVVMVHTVKMEEVMEIVIVTNVHFKNRNLRPVHKVFMKRYSSVVKEFQKIQKKYPDTIFYYQVIKRGGLKKYLLLDTIYKNCVKAVYTDDCIQNIKIARGQTLV